MKWFNFFSDPIKETPVVKGSTKSTVVLSDAPIKSTWRNNMWVMTPEVSSYRPLTGAGK